MLIGAAVIAFCAVLGLHFWSRYGAYLKTLRDRDRLERKMIDDLLAQHAEIRAALAPYAESGRVALDVGMYGSIDFTDAKRVLDDILEPFSASQVQTEAGKKCCATILK